LVAFVDVQVLLTVPPAGNETVDQTLVSTQFSLTLSQLLSVHTSSTISTVREVDPVFFTVTVNPTLPHILLSFDTDIVPEHGIVGIVVVVVG